MLDKIKNLLEKAGIKYTLHKVPEGVGTSVAEHIKAFGLDYSDGCATLIFKTDSGLVGLLRRDDTDINNKNFKKLLGTKNMRFADPEEVESLGQKVGLVSPLTLDIQLFMDKKVLSKDTVRIGSGGNEYSLEIGTGDLQKLTEAKVVDVCDFNPEKISLSDSIVLSGITPSSSQGLHLGNYLGAVKQHVEMQSKAKNAMFFIADYHALNTVFDPEVLRLNILNTYIDYLAFGLEPEKENVSFYLESGVPEITELNIILNNVVSMGELNKMHAFKDKLQNHESEENINHGLFNYPVLMAADILIFDTDIVPVGEDQAQHVEIARDIAKHFNNRYGQILTVPELYVHKETARVVGTDGERKMSKSLGNTITVFAPEEEVKKQIFSTKTDPNRIRPTDPGDPTKNPIFSYMKFLNYDSAKLTDFEDRYKSGNVGDVEIKNEFFTYFMDYFKDSRKKREEYSKNLDYVNGLIQKNNDKVRKIAAEKIKQVRRAIGID